MNLKLEEICKATGGKAISSVKTVFSGVGTDTRKSLEGEVFFALKGDNFDAHEYLSNAFDSGAAALVVHSDENSLQEFIGKISIIKVENTLKSFQDLSHYWRKKHGVQVLAITGSNGKTTTKEFAAAIIGKYKPIAFSHGSFNNHWGVPISLLEIRPEHQVAVIEMGMNHPGEISALCKIADPDVVMVTNVGRVHLEGLGGIEGVAKAKQEIYESSNKNAIRIFNLDNPYCLKMYEQFGNENSICFSKNNSSADICLETINVDLEFIEVEGHIRGVHGKQVAKVFGEHNIFNLMSASCLALAAGLTPKQIWEGFAECRTPWGRNQIVNLQSGAIVIFDAYNSNPESLSTMIENSQMVTTRGKRLAVIGEMLEMGKSAADVHYELGRKIARAGFDVIWFVGASRDAFRKGVESEKYNKELLLSAEFDPVVAEKLRDRLGSNDRIWIKGSRGMKLEKVVQTLNPVEF